MLLTNILIKRSSLQDLCGEYHQICILILFFRKLYRSRKYIHRAQAVCTMPLYVVGVFVILWASKTFSGSLDFTNQDIELSYPETTLALRWE